MRTLRLVGLTADGSRLVVGDGDARWELAVDDALVDQVKAARAAAAAVPDVPVGSGAPTPRQVQERIRRGESAADIARTSGVTLEHVARYEGPVLAERAHHARLARLAPVGGRPVEELVEEHMQRMAQAGQPLVWDSWQTDSGSWEVLVRCGRVLVRLLWEPAVRRVSAVDEAGRRALGLMPAEQDTLSAVLRPVASRGLQAVAPLEALARTQAASPGLGGPAAADATAGPAARAAAPEAAGAGGAPVAAPAASSPAAVVLSPAATVQPPAAQLVLDEMGGAGAVVTGPVAASGPGAVTAGLGPMADGAGAAATGLGPAGDAGAVATGPGRTARGSVRASAPATRSAVAGLQAGAQEAARAVRDLAAVATGADGRPAEGRPDGVSASAPPAGSPAGGAAPGTEDGLREHPGGVLDASDQDGVAARAPGSGSQGDAFPAVGDTGSAAPGPGAPPSGTSAPHTEPSTTPAVESPGTRPEDDEGATAEPAAAAPARPAAPRPPVGPPRPGGRQGGRPKRASVPAWDDISGISGRPGPSRRGSS